MHHANEHHPVRSKCSWSVFVQGAHEAASIFCAAAFVQQTAVFVVIFYVDHVVPVFLFYEASCGNVRPLMETPLLNFFLQEAKVFLLRLARRFLSLADRWVAEWPQDCFCFCGKFTM